MEIVSKLLFLRTCTLVQEPDLATSFKYIMHTWWDVCYQTIFCLLKLSLRGNSSFIPSLQILQMPVINVWFLLTQIGVMRKGRLLVEDSPETLLKLYESDLLEQVVLKLCRTDEKSLRRSGSDNGSNASNNNVTEVVVADKHLKAGNKKSSKNSYNVFEKFQENWQLSSQRRSSIRMLHWNGQQEGSDSSVFQRIRALSTVIWLMFMRHPA